MDIKEEDCLSEDVALQNEAEFFTKNDTNGDAVLMNNECEVAIKTKMKSEAPSPDFCSQKERGCFAKYPIKQINCQTVRCSKDYEMDTKTENEEQDLVSDCVSPNVREFLPEGCVIKVKNPLEETLSHSVTKVKKCNSDHEMEFKEEPWWLQTEASSVCVDIKDGDFTPVKSPRLCTEAVCSNIYGDSQLASAELTGKDTSFNYGKDLKRESEESDVTKVPPVEQHVQSEQTSRHSDRRKIYNRTLLINKGERSHRCNICDKSFTQLSALKLHNLIHAGNTCQICEKSFSSLHNLKRHNWIHAEMKPHKCKICEKSFSEFSNLKTHTLMHEGKKPYECEICDKSFTRINNLKMHYLIHEGKKSHKCEICEKSFVHFSHLKQHNLLHVGKKPHKCEICEKDFTKLSSLKQHNLIHEDKKPYKCEICEKSFTRLSNLKQHNLIHECKKPHICEICEKSFTQMSHLKRHSLIHEVTKPHKCETCEKRFIRLSSLKQHNLIHEGKMPHKCEICEKSYSWLTSLKAHSLIHETKKSN